MPSCVRPRENIVPPTLLPNQPPLRSTRGAAPLPAALTAPLSAVPPLIKSTNVGTMVRRDVTGYAAGRSEGFFLWPADVGHVHEGGVPFVLRLELLLKLLRVEAGAVVCVAGRSCLVCDGGGGGGGSGGGGGGGREKC